MATITDAQLVEAGMLTDVILGFRAGMKGRLESDEAMVDMPAHFKDERQRPRIEQFRRGVRIALIWRRNRTALGTARREERNRDFREQGIAYVIDREQVRHEALILLRAAIASEDGFSLPDAELVHDVARSCDSAPRAWEMTRAIRFYDAAAINGTLSTTNSSLLKAMGEWWSSAEALYHAQKFPRRFDVMDRIRDAPDALAAKAIAREMKPERRRDWTSHRVVAMARVAVIRVEQDQEYRRFLLATDDFEIVEDTTNGEHDDFWGVVGRKGVNMSGQIATTVRRLLVARDRRFRIS